MKNLIIRKLKEADLQALEKLYRQFWNEESDIETMKNKYQEIKNDSRYLLLAAVFEDKVVGSIFGVMCEELYGHCRPFLVMEDLIVDENYRGKGIGKALLREIEETGKKLKCSQILFVTETGRKEAISFYEKAGYSSETHIGFKKSLNCQ